MLRFFDPESLTAEQNRKSLRAFNIIKLKRRRKFKVRMCDNGAPRRKFLPREKAKSPTINLEGILATMVIDAYKYMKVETFNIPGA